MTQTTRTRGNKATLRGLALLALAAIACLPAHGGGRDGEPATQRTEAYLGYDDKHLYVVFLAFLQYDALLANPDRTSLETRKNFNADFLITYLIHPGTALYIGYNSNLQNIDLLPCSPNAGCSAQVLRTNRFINDARGLFVKFSYLFRF